LAGTRKNILQIQILLQFNPLRTDVPYTDHKYFHHHLKTFMLRGHC